MVDLLELDTAATIEGELETLKLIIEHIGEGMAVVNTEGIITHFNKAYGRFLDIDPEAQIGRHITDVVENTRLHIVAQTGRAEINESQ